MNAFTTLFKPATRTTTVKIESVADVITERLPLYEGRAVIRIDNGKNYTSINSDEYISNIYKMVAFFQSNQGEKKQKVIATFVKNRPEWDMTAFASFYTANILFPFDTKMNDDELKHLLQKCEPDYLLVSMPQRTRIKNVLKELNIQPILLLADLYRVFEDGNVRTPVQVEENEILLSSLSKVYETATGLKPNPLLKDMDTVLCQYSTSGTTSLPKIVRITHKNIIYQVNEAMDILNIRKNEDFLNLGPYTHIATLLEFIVAKAKEFTVTYFTREADEDDVLEDEIKKLKQQNVRIRAVMAVPKFWIYIMKEVLEEMKNKPVLNSLYKHLISIEKSNNFYDIGALDKAKLISVRSFIRNKLGGYFAYGISSSTKLDPSVVEIFGKLGITVIDVYGATEACGVIAKNSLNESRRGSCGKLIAGTEVKFINAENVPGIASPVGELLIKGDGIAKGYVDEDTNILLDEEGFYNTGDVAYMDKDNWIYIVGRKKELLRWKNGAYVDLMHFSNLMVRSIWIKDAMVTRLGNDDFLSVFIYPDYKRIENDALYKEKIKMGSTNKAALRPLFEEAINYAQSLVGDEPKISQDKIYLLDRNLERTPTHKIKFIRELKVLNLNDYI